MPPELSLPAPHHQVAEKVCKHIPRLRAFVRGADPAQVFASLVSEVNQLPPQVDTKSTLMACLNVSILGLVAGPALGHVHLIPFRPRRGPDAGKTVCQVVVGYQGFLELGFRSGFLSQCNTEVVLRDEEFKRWHTEAGPKFHHDIPLERDLSKPNVRGAYCTYKTSQGGEGFEFVSRAELDEVDTGRNVWRDRYVAMVRKTPVRRASKMWRKTNDLGLAVLLDEQAERGESQVCPEWREEGSEPDTAGNLSRNLDATLSQRVGCESSEDRLAVLRYALADPAVTVAEVFADEGLMRRALSWLSRQSGSGWDHILQDAYTQEAGHENG